MAMIVRQITDAELAWANERYKEIDFVASTPADFIAVVEVDGKKAGLGRVVPVSPGVGELGGMYVLPAFRGRSLAGAIVDYLIAQSGNNTLFCIPFAHLESFYAAHGFHPVPPEWITPPAVAQKYEWCQSHYDQPVRLLVRDVTSDGRYR